MFARKSHVRRQNRHTGAFFSSGHPQKCDPALAQDIVIKYKLSLFVCHTEAHMERQQMLLAGVTVPGGRCVLPFAEALSPRGLG